MSKPLFMWAGGKSKMIKHYLPHMPDTVDVYSEPFFGGGAMFLHVQETYNPRESHICDTNPGIIGIYRSVRDHVGEFVSYLRDLDDEFIPLSKPDRKKLYYEVRQAHAFDYQSWSPVREAAVLYFLMKTGFNGIWQVNKNTGGRFGTPSGLLNQRTSCFDWSVIDHWNQALQRTEILCGDWSVCPPGDFTFMDPPYRESFTTYGTGWGDAECDALLSAVRSMPGLVFVCNRDDEGGYFNSRVHGMEMHKFPVTYTAGRRKKTNEGFEAKRATEVLIIKKG